jgi:putative DNA primase/helicase
MNFGSANVVSTAARDPKKDPSRKPPTLPVLPEEVPIVLTALPQWIRWRWTWDGKRGAWTKVPIRPLDSKNASATDPATWGPFQTVVANLGNHAVDGIGFVFSASDPFCGVDLDSCRDPGSREVTQDARAIVEELRGYAEVSVTGTGVHIIVRASLGDLGGKKKGFLEVYDRARYFAVTGHPLVLPDVLS